MRLDEYQEATKETAIYPNEFPDFVTPGMVYTAMGLSDEAGEVLGKIKKAIREDDPSYLDDVPDEIGDVQWYMARLCDELGLSAGGIAEDNLGKLLDRKERGVLEGEGDSR